MSQIIAMANRLQEAEQTIVELKRMLETETSPGHRGTAADRNRTTELEPHVEVEDNSVQDRANSVSAEFTSGELLSDLSLDEHGKVGGSTTSFIVSRLIGADLILRPYLCYL